MFSCRAAPPADNLKLSPKWRECIKKVWAVDPLSCPKCGSEMKTISFINETDGISRILEHLGLWEEKIPLEYAPPDLVREKSCESHVCFATEKIICGEPTYMVNYTLF